jgi:hypothetical protein
MAWFSGIAALKLIDESPVSAVRSAGSDCVGYRYSLYNIIHRIRFQRSALSITSSIARFAWEDTCSDRSVRNARIESDTCHKATGECRAFSVNLKENRLPGSSTVSRQRRRCTHRAIEWELRGQGEAKDDGACRIYKLRADFCPAEMVSRCSVGYRLR